MPTTPANGWRKRMNMKTYKAFYQTHFARLFNQPAEWNEVGPACFADARQADREAWQGYNGHKKVVVVENDKVVRVARKCDKMLVGQEV